MSEFAYQADEDGYQDPDESLHNQVSSFMSSGQWDRAIQALTTLLSTQPNSAWLHYQLAYCFKNTQNYKDSEKHFKLAIGQMPDFADAFQGIAGLYLNMGRNGAAEDNIRKALELNPHDDHSWLIMAHLQLNFENPKEAIFCADKALSINPENQQARSIRTRAQGELTGNDKLDPHSQIAELQELLESNPEDDITHMHIGILYYDELKDYKKAEEHFRIALRLDPEDKTYQTLLIKALRKRDKALRILWLPLSPVLKVLAFFEWMNQAKWRWIFFILLLPVLKYIVVICVAISVTFFLFVWPMVKTYEFLTLVEVHKKMGKLSLYSGPLEKIHRQPFALRVALCLSVFALFWGGILYAFSNTTSRIPLIAGLSSIILVAVILFYILSWGSLFFDAWKKRARKKKDKHFHSSISQHES
ncbi:tetratricopeptide repeat protein [Rubritalea tangerina]|uniref:Tetratricopeptide repeat protein n=1 Tax=Rubritalea tangerina TaxID=430798 RepID=A0ABW4ZEJ1_9BACT